MAEDCLAAMPAIKPQLAGLLATLRTQPGGTLAGDTTWLTPVAAAVAGSCRAEVAPPAQDAAPISGKTAKPLGASSTVVMIK